VATEDNDVRKPVRIQDVLEYDAQAARMESLEKQNAVLRELIQIVLKAHKIDKDLHRIIEGLGLDPDQ
jgi:hypothetical protein